MIKAISVFIVLILTTQSFGAIPTITSVSTLTDGQTVTVTGSSFLTRGLTYYASDNFDDSIDSVWTINQGMVRDTTVVDQREGSVGLVKSSIQLNDQSYLGVTTYVDSDQWIAAFWMKMDSTFYTGTQSYLCPTIGECDEFSPNTNIKVARWYPVSNTNPNWYSIFGVSGADCARNSIYTGWNLELLPAESTLTAYDYPSFNDEAWHYVEYQFQHASGPSVSDGKVRTWIDGKLIVSDDAVLTDRNDREPMRMASLGWRSVTCQQEAEAYFYMDDAYVDVSIARLVIGDNTDYDNCTYHELQPDLTSWANGEITFTFSKRSIGSEPVYAFVVSSTGEISEGFLIGSTPTASGTIKDAIIKDAILK